MSGTGYIYIYIFLFSINWSTLIIRSILLRYRLLTWRDPSVEITETRGLVFIRVQKKKSDFSDGEEGRGYNWFRSFVSRQPGLLIFSTLLARMYGR